MKWHVEILWHGAWVRLPGQYNSRDDAEWETAKWKQQNQCYADPFRAVQVAQGDPAPLELSRIDQGE